MDEVYTGKRGKLLQSNSRDENKPNHNFDVIIHYNENNSPLCRSELQFIQ